MTSCQAGRRLLRVAASSNIAVKRDAPKAARPLPLRWAILCRPASAGFCERCGEFEASIALGDAEILAGELPRKQLRLVQAWIELHRDELMADWELAVSGENPYKIEPL
ncbi:DUF4160 domain-containing protein [Acidithiobacillus sp. IBUN Pt1247-S3]|uniref:DUF4160 domain-containing protein n=1 Tax=Acidithiobacillus sp. IBUN Pt1247-S3 TaxID=3166642 RepID=UPI0034E44523